jgi:hypothetical protein
MRSIRISSAGGNLIACGAALFVLSCGGPTEPSTKSASVTDVRYQHVVPFKLEADTRVELEFWNCTRSTGRDGPVVCLATSTDGVTYRCPDPTFMQQVPTTCDNGMDVLLRTASRNPQLQVAHDIYVNGTRLSRITELSPVGYQRESAAFSIDARGRVR